MDEHVKHYIKNRCRHFAVKLEEVRSERYYDLLVELAEDIISYRNAHDTGRNNNYGTP